jgi:hypothetical protein
MKLRRQRFAQGWKSRIEFGATCPAPFEMVLPEVWF